MADGKVRLTPLGFSGVSLLLFGVEGGCVPALMPQFALTNVSSNVDVVSVFLLTQRPVFTVVQKKTLDIFQVKKRKIFFYFLRCRFC